jgi:hypothetical protein
MIVLLITWEDTGKSISLFNELINRNGRDGLILALAKEGGRGIHVGAHAKPATSLFSNGELITSDHLNIDAKVKSTADGLCTIMPWRVKEGQETQELPRLSCTLLGLL